MGRIACVALVLLALLPPAARADSIVFRRGTDIWLMAPDGTGARQVTRDGLRYEWPSAADDGTILAAESSGRLHRLSPSGAELGVIPTAAASATEDAPAETATHVRISPDGTRIAYDEAIGGDVTTLWTPSASATLAFPGQTTGQEGLIGPSWIGNDRLLLSRDVSAEDGPAFSLYTVGGGDNSAVPWFDDDGAPWATGFDAAASRSGARVAVVEDDAADAEGAPTRVALRLFTGTRFRCELRLEALETYDATSPTFSPDGSRLAWAQSDGIHVATLGALDDCAAIRQRVVTLPGAWEPYWSAADLPVAAPVAGAPAPAPAKLVLALKTRTRPHRLTVVKRGIVGRVTVSAPATVRLTVRSGGRLVGSATRKVVNAGTVKLRVRVKRVSRRLVMRVSAPGAKSVAATIRPR